MVNLQKLKMNILIVDKFSPISDILKEHIERNFISTNVLTCNSPNEAIELIKDFMPKIIISGARFTNAESGMSFLIKCKARYKYNYKFIIMSSYPTHSPECYLANGADLFIDKKQGIDNLFERINSTIFDNSNKNEKITSVS